jgi:VWFA-related protein
MCNPTARRCVGIRPSLLILLFFVVWTLIPVPARAQTPAPASPQEQAPPPSLNSSGGQPQSATPSSQDSHAAGESTAEMTTHETNPPFKVPVNLVLVRVVVRDEKGQVVKDLKSGDFQLFDDRKPQIITHFAVETPSPQPAPAAKPPAGTDETAKPAAPPAIPARFVALLFDDVHLDTPTLAQSKLAAVRFVSSGVGPTDRVALFTVSGQDQVDFTDDRDKVSKVLGGLIPRNVTAADVSGKSGCPTMDYYEADLIANHNDSSALVVATADALACMYNNDARMVSAAQALATSTAYQTVNAAGTQTDYTLRRLQEIVRRISVLPGQRSIVLVSPGFLYFSRETDLSELIDKAMRSNVMINTLDARGLYTPDDGTDISQQYNGSVVGAGPKSVYYITAQNLQGQVLEELADGTGAVYFHNSNDLDAGFRQVAGAPLESYLLGFSPVGMKPDGKFHQLKVSLTGKLKYTVQARRGYYSPKRNTDPAEIAKQEVAEAVFSQEEIHDLPAELHTQFFKGDQSDAQISVLTRVNVGKLRFRKEDGRNKNVLTVVSAVFDRNGNYVTGNEKTIELRLRDATLESLERTGMTVKSNFDVKPGAYMVRLVVRDSEASLLTAENGMVEIPK